MKFGKGKIYYNDGNIKYDGEFIDDKFEGFGKYFSKNGGYYIGEWRGNKPHGKGKLLLNKGYIFKNDILLDGKYLNGEKRNGKGKQYYKNGK